MPADKIKSVFPRKQAHRQNAFLSHDVFIKTARNEIKFAKFNTILSSPTSLKPIRNVLVLF